MCTLIRKSKCKIHHMEYRRVVFRPFKILHFVLKTLHFFWEDMGRYNCNNAALKTLPHKKIIETQMMRIIIPHMRRRPGLCVIYWRSGGGAPTFSLWRLWTSKSRPGGGGCESITFSCQWLILTSLWLPSQIKTNSRRITPEKKLTFANNNNNNNNWKWQKRTPT